MPGLPPDLNRTLRELLLRCGPFDSTAELRALFVDARLRPWRDRVPEAPNRQARVQALIALLVDAANVAGENALVLFVDVLRDSVDPGTACHRDLDALAAELAGVLQPERARQTPAHAAVEQGVHVGGDVHGDAVTGSKSTTFDQREQHVQQQTNVAGDYHDQRGGSTYVTYIEHATGIAIGDGAQSVQVVGDGNVIGNNNRVDVRKGGIRAGRIEAENVVSGVMAPTEALEQAEGLVALAHAIERGGIEADTIKARNVVDGLLINVVDPVAQGSARKLCVDAAVPSKVTIGKGFILAVSIRAPAQPALHLESLDKTESEDFIVVWPDGSSFLSLRLTLSAPGCVVVGGSERAVRYYPEHAPSVHRFQLVPQILGLLSILVTVYQEEFSLGGKDVETLVADEHLAGEVSIALDTSVLKTADRSSPEVDRMIPRELQERRVAPVADTDRAGATPQPGVLDLPAMRARLARLDDVELDTLCMDYFPEVYDRFSRGMRRDEKVNLLLDHCRRRSNDAMQLKSLLRHA